MIYYNQNYKLSLGLDQTFFRIFQLAHGYENIFLCIYLKDLTIWKIMQNGTIQSSTIISSMLET